MEELPADGLLLFFGRRRPRWIARSAAARNQNNCPEYFPAFLFAGNPGKFFWILKWANCPPFSWGRSRTCAIAHLSPPIPIPRSLRHARSARDVSCTNAGREPRKPARNPVWAAEK